MWLWSITGLSPDEALDRLLVLLGSGMLASAFLSGPVAEFLQERARRRFAAEGDDAVGKWAPLKEATVNIRLSQNYGGEHPINRRTGELERWVVDGGWNAYPTSYGAEMAYPGSIPTGELLEKVQVAQRGDDRAVARPVLGLTDTDLIAATIMFADFISEGMKV